MTRTRETRFSEPASIGEAESRIATLLATIGDIDAQLKVWDADGAANPVWKRQALGAKARYWAERCYLRRWLHEQETEDQRAARLELARLKTERVLAQQRPSALPSAKAGRAAAVARLTDAILAEDDPAALALIGRLYYAFCAVVGDHGVVLSEQQRAILQTAQAYLQEAASRRKEPTPILKESA